MTTAPATDAADKKSLTKLQRAIVDGLEDVKAGDIRVFDTTHLSPLFERVIIATGNTNRQTKALAASVRDAVRDAGLPKPRSEGEDNGEWIIIDCGAAVCHIMQPAIRQYYRLEEIWGDKPVRMKLGDPKPRMVTAPPEEPVAKVRKASAKRTAAAKPVARKAAAKKPAAKRTTAQPVAAQKVPAKKAAPVKTMVVNKPVAKKVAAKREAVKRTVPAKATAKRTSSRKA